MDLNVNYVSEMNDFQKGLLQSLRERVQDQLQPDADDHFLFRFLKARRFDLLKAEKMLLEHLKFRRQFGQDSILETYTLPEVLRKYSAVAYLGFDSGGDIILYYRSGIHDFKGLCYSLTYEEIIKYFVHVIEYSYHAMKENNEKTGLNGCRFVVISDLAGLSLREVMDKRVLKAIVDLLPILQDNCPEILKRLFILNVPRYFTIWLSVIKRLVDSYLLTKIALFDKDGWQEEMFQSINPDLIPAAYGGNLRDPDGRPECFSLYPKETKVPKSYYLDHNTDIMDPEMNKVLVKERASFDHVIHVNELGSVIKWHFRTVNWNVMFGVYFVPSTTMSMVSSSQHWKFMKSRYKKTVHQGYDVVLPLERLESHGAVQQGEIACDKIGMYLLHFDNTFSWFRSKELYYKIEILSPSEIIEMAESCDLESTAL